MINRLNFLKTLLHYPGRNPLAYKVLLSVLLFSSAITLLATALQLYTNFNKDVEYMEKRVQQIRAGYSQSLSLGVWDLDRKQLYTLLNGISTLPDIQYLEIRDTTGKTYIKIGDKRDENSITHTFPLDFTDSRSNIHAVGEFEIVASLTGVYKRLRESVLQILIAQSIKTFLVSTFILLVIRHYITRHLTAIAQFVNRDRPTLFPALISLQRKPGQQPDELDHLVVALNQMRSELQLHLHEREEREQKLTQTRNYVRQIIDLMPSVIIGVDNCGRITQWNREAGRLTGISSAKAFGSEVDQLFPRLAADYGDILNAIHSGSSLKKPRVKSGTGKSATFYDITIYPLSEEHNEGVVVRMDHITDRLKVEEMMIQNEKMVSVGLLAAGVAHEINNPINSVINLAEIQKSESEAGSTTRDIAERIVNEGTRIAGIVKSLLSFSRRDINRKHSVHCHTVLLETLVLMQTQLKKDGIHVQDAVPDNLPAIPCYMQQIQQVFLNILTNAQYALNEKYATEHPEKILRISAEQIELDGHKGVRFIFHDNGTGIPAELIEDVKDPFFSTKPSEIGTGLGISISNEIITAHNGTLEIVSREGEYTKVIIELPAE